MQLKGESQMLTKQNLNIVFDTARNEGVKFVFVGIEAEGIKEVIAVPSQSFDAKQSFYNNAYSDDLVHVMNSKVRLFGLTHGDESAILELV